MLAKAEWKKSFNIPVACGEQVGRCHIGHTSALEVRQNGWNLLDFVKSRRVGNVSRVHNKLCYDDLGKQCRSVSIFDDICVLWIIHIIVGEIDDRFSNLVSICSVGSSHSSPEWSMLSQVSTNPTS